VISNNIDTVCEIIPNDKIVKPINGGGYCRDFSEIISKTQTHENKITSQPAICQEKLIQPELRIYGIRKIFFCFWVLSESLDYRENQDCELKYVPNEEIDENIFIGLALVMSHFGLNFCAADFKTNPEDGKLLFLEINSSPMFVVQDKTSEGKLTKEMWEALYEETI